MEEERIPPHKNYEEWGHTTTAVHHHPCAVVVVNDANTDDDNDDNDYYNADEMLWRTPHVLDIVQWTSLC